MLSVKEIRQICKIFNSINPDPKIELKSINNFTLLIAIVLSAQSTDKMVNRCTESLFKVCATPEDVLSIGKAKFTEYVKYIGIYRNKTNYIFCLSQVLLQDYNGIVPSTFKELIKLPGVGAKTANVFLNSAFGKPTIGVDRHILRIVKKIGISNGETPDAVMKDLKHIIPVKYHKQIHHWLVLHGRYICKATKQLCSKCPISSCCEEFNKKLQTNLS
ncbi:MAG: endonuclease III [Alphaproteobacteria bacterium]|nr:endonuclease III [Rickettsiales bacterium]